MPCRQVTYLALASSLVLASCSKTEPAKPYAVEEVPLAQISADLAAGKTTSVAVTKAYIERIKMYDAPLHAVIAVAPDALDQAAAADKRRADKKALGPLDGVPIMLKDNIEAIGMPNTAGSYALAANMPAQDAEAARRLRAAGAVILGKLNMNQFAGLRTSMGLLGSTVGGTPHNPYDLTRTPGGSSSGSAIASAASFAAATLGSDTTGSIISPSSLNGLVGMRPTVALISRRGIVPISLTQDSSGPMARTVTDAAMLLTVVAGSDPGDPASKDADAHKADYTKGLTTDALKGKKLGVLRGTGGYDEKTQPVFDAALEVLKAQGAELVDLPADTLEDLSQEDRVILTHEFKDDLNAYLAGTGPGQKVRTMTELVAFNKVDPHESTHSQDLMEASEATNGRKDEDYIKAFEYARRRAGPDGIEKGLAGVSAIVVLTTGPAEVIVPEGAGGGHTISERPKGSRPASPSMNAAIAGYPDLTVPMGMVEGMPVGLSFIGPMWSEQSLLAYGYAYEQASHARAPPAAYKTAK
ncbi:MAG: amidase family protein [Rhodospirillaceae bacterium]